MNNYLVVLSPKAKTMLEDHIYFLAQVNFDSAKYLRDSILKSLRSLETMPLRFPVMESKNIRHGKYRKMLIEKRYLAIFQIKDNTVFVDYIVDCRENYEWLL